MQQRGLDFGGPSSAPARRRPLTVSELTERVQGVLESDFPDVAVEGELSNFKAHASGHWYFSLKDDKAQLKAVAWGSTARRLRFRPRDGMKVVARGSLRVYAPRGEYQLQVEALEPLGKGELQQAFEDLKEKLGKEGLFDPARKRPLPLLPRRIAVITSPSGAVIQDILRVLGRRHRNLEVLIYPARVQGGEAAPEIVQGLRALNRLEGVDVIVLARGGGSLEDLWAFNDEAVARALAASRIPTVSAVGHETDYTIADFVADLRAPTPSAAAELVVAAKEEMAARIDALSRRQASAVALRLARARQRFSAVAASRVLALEQGRVGRLEQHRADLSRRALATLLNRLDRARLQAGQAQRRLDAFRWDRQLGQRQERVAAALRRLQAAGATALERGRARLGGLAAQLESLSPLAVLGRGYGLVWRADGRLVRDPREVSPGDPLRIRVHGGSFPATVSAKEPS